MDSEAPPPSSELEVKYSLAARCEFQLQVDSLPSFMMVRIFNLVSLGFWSARRPKAPHGDTNSAGITQKQNRQQPLNRLQPGISYEW